MSRTTFERDGEPRRIPESWAAHGRQETPTSAERSVYAIRAVPGWREFQAEYHVPGNGTYPDHESVEPQLEVLYVTRDLRRAVERRVTCRRSDGAMRPTDGFRAVRAERPDVLGIVESPQACRAYRRDLTALYGADVVADEQASGPPAPDFSTGSELRADGGDRDE